MAKVIILFLLVISNGIAKDAPTIDIAKITATEEEIIIDGAQLENIEGVSLRSLDKKITKEYQLDSATGEKVTAHTIDRKPIPSDKYLYLVVNKLGGEVFYPITLTSQGNKKVIYKISQKKKKTSQKKIEVDDKSEINFFPGQDFSGYDYDYSILVNSNGDLVIKGFDQNLFKLDQRGNLEIAGTLKVKGKTIVPYAPTNSDMRISNVVIGEDNNISGVVNFTSSGNMDVATGTFKVDSSAGTVGIGTSTPTYKLDIKGTTNAGIRLTQAAPSTSTSGSFFNGLTFQDPGQIKSFGLGYGVSDLFGINSFDGTNYRNIFSLGMTGDAAIAGTLKVGSYILPSSAGATGTILQSSGGGVVTWATPPQSVPIDGGVANLVLTSNGTNNPTWNNTLANIQYMDYSSTATVPAWKEGRLFYNSTNRNLAYYNQSAGVTVDIGEELLLLARNNTGSLIQDGSAVYISGAQGNRPTIALSKADNAATARIIGITTQDIANNSDGYVTMGGLIRGLDTSAFTNGAILYVSDTVAGGYTTAAPPIAITAALVVNAHQTQGVLGVTPAVAAGNVRGPTSSVDGRPAVFSGTSGRLLANTVPYTIPTINGVSGQVLTTNGAGITSWTTAGAGNVVGAATSTVGNIPSFADTTGKVINDSGIFSGNVPVMANGAGALYRPIISADSAKNLIAAPYSFPNLDGVSGQVLVNNGSGGLDWGVAQTQVVNWQASTAYDQNDLVVSLDALIRAKQNYTSSAISPIVDLYDGKIEWIAPSPLATGVVEGGAVTFGAGSSVDITSGRGVISNYSTGLIPSFSYVKWTAGNLALSDPNGWNTIYVNSAGTISSIGGIQGFTFSDDNIILAYVNPTVSEISSARTYTTDPVSQIKELASFLGTPKKGMTYSGNVDLTFKRAAGSLFSWGSNWGTEDPNTKGFSSVPTVSFYYTTMGGLVGGARTALDPNNYNNTGTNINNIPGGNAYTYQRIYQSISGKVALLYGQKVYSSQGEAIDGISLDAASVVVPLILQTSFKWVGTVVMRDGGADASSFVWRNCGYFGCEDSGGAGGGGGNGDVFGPASAVTNTIAMFVDATGKNLKTSPYTLPTENGTAGQVLATDGAGTTSWTTVGGTGGVSGPPTNSSNTLALWDGVNTKTLKETQYSFPTTDGLPGQILRTNGAGVVSWVNPPASGLLEYPYVFSNETDGAPPSTPMTNGQVRLNDPFNPINAATMYVHVNDINGISRKSKILLLGIGDTVDLTYGDGSNDYRYTVNGALIDSGTYIIIPIVQKNVVGFISDNTAIQFGMVISAKSNFASLNLPKESGTNGQVLSTDGAGFSSWVDILTGPVLPTLPNRPVLFADSSGKSLIDAPYTLPVSSGTTGQVLGLTGVGTADWVNAGTGNVLGPNFATINRMAIYGDGSGKVLAESDFSPPLGMGSVGQVLTSNGDGTTKWGIPAGAPTRASLPSDRKLKEDIKDLTENYIDKIMDLRPVSFVWKDTLNPDIGFIAQEVKKVFPYLVEEDAGYIGVNYQKMVVPLVKAVQEQQKEIERYKDAISRLEERIQKLEGKNL